MLTEEQVQNVLTDASLKVRAGEYVADRIIR